MPKVTEEGLKKIEEKIETIFTTEMEVDDFEGDSVPSVDDLPDKNKGLIVTNCTILFVDIRSSTKLSDKSQAKSMAKIYRAFARAMSMCVYESGGRVRQIAGDRVMGVFVDDAEESSIQKAMDAARAITSVVEYIFNPLCRKNVNQKEIACGVGIDTGRILVTPIGIKHQGDDSRDLVWAGKTANVASKHTDLAEASEIL
ncbi:adenylate/guanylate cyclase domain-containing protein [Bacillus atrophaeus]|uniref:adenylate/guanylate cyclase domain-containing protein n=1 Tax=Bacillus atrophaeus TaxID=1452 RepID=UPI00227EE927|nr:adenylate/guanylate cyclase domain-containing protein [Bacillus atrophaeus]MCY8916775.1 adenylate/guanylate cyclase domain-containing protein [Bacillus atrophaeus]MCY8925599.1 adenylate/guanylate cyclase domain-containing protein [Bacillus atrophaeus]